MIFLSDLFSVWPVSTYFTWSQSHYCIWPSCYLVDPEKKLGVPCEAELVFAEPKAFWGIGGSWCYFSSSLLVVRMWFQGKLCFTSSVLEIFFCSCESPQYRIQIKEAFVDATELHEFSCHIVSYSSPTVWVKFEFVYKTIAIKWKAFYFSHKYFYFSHRSLKMH